MQGARLAMLVAGLLLASPGRAGEPAAPTLDRCAAQVARAPRDDRGYRCFRDVANRDGTHAEAFARVEAILAVDPGNDLARWTLAGLDTALGSRRAAGLFESAIAGFERDGHGLREARARLDWSHQLQRAGRSDEAASQLERAKALAAELEDDDLAIRLAIAEAWQSFRRGDYADADSKLAGSEARLAPLDDPQLRAERLSVLGALAWARGRWDEALASYREEARLCGETGNRYQQAAALANVALLASRRIGWRTPTADDRREVGALLDGAEAAAVAGGNVAIRGAVAFYRAQLSTDDLETRAMLERAVELSARGGNVANRLAATRFLAESLALVEPRDRDRSSKLVAEAVEEAYRHGDLDAVARARIVEASLAWRLGDEEGWDAARRQGAFALIDRAVEAIEALRDLQADDAIRAEVFSAWTFFYDRVLGHLLGGPGGPPSRADLGKAFEIAERMRARVLLERLDAAGIPLTGATGAGEIAARHGLLEEAARIRVELSSPLCDEATRRDHLARLEALSREDEALRERLAAIDPRFRRLRLPEIPTLDEAEATLRSDEAILAFTTGSGLAKAGYIGGGSWLMLVTREGTRAYAVAGEETLAREAALFAGLFESRAGEEAAGAVRLHDRLMREALDDLPAGIETLVLIPDGPLHQVPFAALRARADAPPLGVRFALVAAPSVATWLRWRLEAARTVPSSALVIADPQAGHPDEAALRAVRGALPHARREARLISSVLGGRSRILEGADASETRVKEASLRRFGILHVAAHAQPTAGKLDDGYLILRPGGAGEDGRLTGAEASLLDLDGRIVVLAACRTAGGPYLEGEGVQSLARGFLAGGARVVVGSLWPLRDDEAADFFDAFYRKLGLRLPVAEAFAAAQRERVAAGVPAAAWAGIVLVGDGAARLEAADALGRWSAIGAALALAVAIAGAWVLRGRLGRG